MKFTSLENPDLPECYHLLKGALLKRALIIIVGCSRIFYEGRAKSKLEWGDRTIIIKEDGSFLVHQHHKLEPVNWQPPKSKFTVEIDEGKIILRGSRRNPTESLQVEICKIYLASYFQGKDTRSLELVGYEADMGDLIIKNPDIIEEGFRPTSREYAVSSGFIDILGKDKEGKLMILELKSRRAGVNAAKQLARYISDFEDHKNNVRGVLVAPSITDEALEILEEKELEFISLKPPMELKDQKVMTLEDFRG
jgi:endonuclease